jgi:hypothetical protein
MSDNISKEAQDQLNNQLFDAIKNNKLEEVKKSIDGRANVNVKRVSKTPIYLAVEKGNLEIVQVLLANGADVNVNLGLNGETPLYVAAQNGNIDIVKALIKHEKTEVNLPNADEDTPLHVAVSMGNTDVAKKLIESGKCDFSLKNNKGADIWTCAKNNQEMTKLLKDKVSSFADKVAKYLDGQFNIIGKNGGKLTDKRKQQIKKGLTVLIEAKKNISSDIDVDKVVSRAARYHPKLQQGIIDSIKKCFREVIDLFFKEKKMKRIVKTADVVDVFKKNISKKNISENPPNNETLKSSSTYIGK